MAKLGNVKTASELLSALAAGAAKRPSADELFEQRVSFIYGSVGSKSNVTRDQIRKVLEAEGAGVVWNGADLDPDRTKWDH